MNINMSNPIDRTKDGECSQCGRCCSAILCVSDAEVSKIKHYLGQHPEVKMIDRNNVLQKDFIDVCPFLSEEKKCQIYEVRPEICRRFICSKYKNADNQPLNHRNKKIINMITTFNQTGTCFNAPNLKELNKFYKEKKKEVYG